MTVAAIDRLVHHAVILEMNVESYRRRTALTRVAAISDTAVSPAAVAPATSSPTPE